MAAVAVAKRRYAMPSAAPQYQDTVTPIAMAPATIRAWAASSIPTVNRVSFQPSSRHL